MAIEGSRASFAAEQAARESYGRLLSTLVRRTRDIAAAEDALSEAFAAALQTWPETGVPDAPDAWLLTAARRKISHAERHKGVKAAAAQTIETMYEAMQARSVPDFPDERLKLLFVCAHPAIDEGVRAPLMLQTILGLDAVRIAGAFVEKPATMGQRLVRAKTKIRDAGIGFEVPDTSQLAGRLDDVLNAVYAAFTIGWDMVDGADTARDGLTGEAIFLARLVCGLMPDEPEPKGLLALMLYGEARAGARRSASGDYIPLRSQDRRLWNRDMVVEAETLLATAARMGRFGRFQTEAAIQSLHVQAAVTGKTAAQSLLKLYDVLCEQSPTLGALTARAAAYGEWGSPEAGLALLAELPADKAETYQSWWAVRAHLLKASGDMNDASDAARQASSMTADEAVKAYFTREFGI